MKDTISLWECKKCTAPNSNSLTKCLWCFTPKSQKTSDIALPKINIRETDYGYQATAVFSDGRDYHAIGLTPFAALRRLATFWENRECK